MYKRGLIHELETTHQRVRSREQSIEGFLLSERERTDVLTRPLRRDGVEVVNRGRPKYVQDYR